LLSALAIVRFLLCSQIFPLLLILAAAARAVAARAAAARAAAARATAAAARAAAAYIYSSMMNNRIATICIYQYINVIHNDIANTTPNTNTRK
jgi:hypothetical protein